MFNTANSYTNNQTNNTFTFLPHVYNQYYVILWDLGFVMLPSSVQDSYNCKEAANKRIYFIIFVFYSIFLECHAFDIDSQ